MVTSQLEAANGAVVDTGDLGPLAWVLEETRKSIESSTKSLKRFVHEAESARGVDMASLDAGHLRMARQQLHQVVGALDMVGQSVASQMVRGMEAAVQQFVQRPEICSDEAASAMERAGFALLEYLEGQLGDRPRPPLGLFPQYRQVQELAGADRIHPADLWPQPWRWIDPATPASPQRLSYGPEVRARLDHGVLKLMRKGDANAASELSVVSLGLADGATSRHPVVFWKLSSGFFEALAHQLMPADVYVKRAASRILLQYAALAKGEQHVSERLALELLFFCAQARPGAGMRTPVLGAIRSAWNLGTYQPVDYNEPAFGLFDPAVLAQARRRVESVKENWSALAGGDLARKKSTVDQFGLVAESLLKLHPKSKALADVLSRVATLTAQSGKPPSAELAMETATAVLFLEASFADFQPGDQGFGARTTQLAQRLDAVLAGGAQQPLEPWMEELYSRVSDRQTMGTVVGELRVTLGEAEQFLDQFFRHPEDKTPLGQVPGLMSQMRGVLSVLGLDQAAQAVARMRETVDCFIASDEDAATLKASGSFERLGSNLGALGFLVDTLGYQPVLAKKLFAYDAETGELRPLMGRVAPEPGTVAQVAGRVDMELSGPDVETEPNSAGLPEWERAESSASPQANVTAAPAGAVAEATVAAAVVGASQPAVLAAAEPVAEEDPKAAAAAVDAGAASDDVDAELLEIFLEEAREVVGNGQEAVQALTDMPGDMEQQTTLRRAFHTLKGSSRMVGLNEFGEAAWSMEQLLNAWLPEEKPVTPELRGLASDALAAFGTWVEDIAQHTDARWKAAPFTASADALRKNGEVVALVAGQPADGAEPQVTMADAAASAPAELDADALEADADMPSAFSDTLNPAARVEGEPEAPVAPLAITAFDLPDLELDADQAGGGEVNTLAVKVGEPVLDDSAFADFSSKVDVVESDPAEVGSFSAFADLAASPAQERTVSTQDSDLAEGVTEADVAGDEPLLSLDLQELSFVDDEEAAGKSDVSTTLPADNEPLALELPELDFAAQLPAVADEEVSEPMVAEEAAAPEMDVPAEPVAADEPAEDVSSDGDDASLYREIGDLKVSIPLYNVYLSEADEWSRQLIADLSEWALMLNEQVPERAIARAHSLAGSSATVGFTGLSGLARAIEHALQRLHGQGRGTSEQAKTLVEAAEDVRRVLHQFAAGILKEPNPQVLEAVQQLEPTEAEPVAEVDEEAAEEPQAGPVEAEVARAAATVRTQDAAAAGQTPRQSIADDIDVVDAVDEDLFPIFEEEAEELLPELGRAMRDWVGNPEDRGAHRQVMRGLHTLKGSARLAGALRLGEMAHRTESAIEQLGSESLEREDLEPLLDHLDDLQAAFRRLQTRGEPAAELADDQVTVQTIDTEAPVVPQQPTAEAAVPSATPAIKPVPGGSVAQPVGLSLTTARAHAQQAVRVRAQLLDRLVNQAGEVITSRARLEAEVGQLRTSLTDLTGNLERLRLQLRDVELQAETQMQSRLALAKDADQGFDPLEFDRFTRMQELTRMMAESVNDVATVQRTIQRAVDASEDDLAAQARQSRELQRDLLRTRMVEFEGISERLYRVVRQASKEAGKQVRLDITGGSIEMDRGILDRMTPAFEHLLRNCVVHGIETQAVREARSKDPVGSIAIEVLQSGNDVSVTFRDDGGGLNAARIRERAVQRGLIAPDQQLSDQEVAGLIFEPGFSTATEVTELAGRGVGMDVVHTEIRALGGRVETSFREGQGTSFKLVMPLTTAVTHVVMLRAGNLAVGVPSNLVEIVRRATVDELAQAYRDGHFAHGGEDVPFYWSGALLQSSSHSTEPPAKSTPVIVFRSAAQRVALHVDEVLGHQEVVVKSLGPQLARLPGLVAITALASGAVALIYNPVAMANVYGEQAHAFSALHAQTEAAAVTEQGSQPPTAVVAEAPKSDIPLVLVVDDSITVRRVTQRLLQREGYRVALANDGLQGLERLQAERPAVVLSDIEMPRMDGFDFVRNIRADEKLRDLPVVMITSRIAEKHREHARELGVNDYLGKPYSEEELLGLIKRYAREAAAAR